MKYVIYARKSQDREDKQILSIESQVKEGLEIARRHNLEVSKVLKEEKSAKKPGRKIFNDLLASINKGEYFGIICWKLDRLARNAADGGTVIQLIDDKKLMEVITPGRIYQNKGDDKLWMQLEFGMAKKYVDDLSDNVKRGLRDTFEKGNWIRPTPRGYLNIDKEGRIAGKNYDKTKQRMLDDLNRPLRRVEIDPVLGPLIKNLFEYASFGEKTLLKVREHSFKLGLKTKGGNKLSIEVIRQMLNNTFYYGLMENNGVEKVGDFEPLITKHLFEQVKKNFEERSKTFNIVWDHAYKGLMRCPRCGTFITATTKTKHYKGTNRTAHYTYYHCTGRKGPCGNPWITEKELETQIQEKIKGLTLNNFLFETIMEFAQEEHKKHLDVEVFSRTNLVKELNCVDQKLKRLLEMRINEELTEEEYKRSKTELLNQKIEVEEKLNDSSDKTKSWLERLEDFLKTCTIANDVFLNGTTEEKRNLIKSLGWNLYLDNKKLSWEYSKPFDYLIKPLQISSNIRSKEDLKLIWRPILELVGNF